MTAPRVVLASTSPYRRELLARLRLPFDVASPGTDESPRVGEAGIQLAQRLAREKAEAVADRYPDRTVIGSDQVAMLESLRLDKPGTRDNAIAQLTRASGQTVVFHTAVCMVSRHRSLLTEAVDTTSVTFRHLDAPLIERYVDLEQPFDCAGSAKVEGLGIALIDGVETSDPTGLIGLPLIAVTRMLLQHGIGLMTRGSASKS
ncbi:MAG: Maf family nucleotide pyrophosphatase [Burkholderiales bacterium]